MGLTTLQWAQERLANTERIAATKVGADRDSWLEDMAYWMDIVSDLAALGKKDEQIARLKTLAKQATNGWACFARRDIEHDEIARLHQAIDGRPIDPHVFAICPECRWRTRDDRKPQHRAGCQRPAPTAWEDQDGNAVISPANTEALKP